MFKLKKLAADKKAKSCIPLLIGTSSLSIAIGVISLSIAISTIAIFSLPSRAETIQGGVSDQVTAVEPALQAGTVFSQNALPQQQLRGWYKIPPWFAGMTRRDRIYSTNPNGGSYKSERVRERGRQRDINGEIWECRREPIYYQIDQGSTMDWTILRKEEPLWIGDNRVLMKYLGNMIKVDKASNRVVDVDQTLQTHDFRPGPNGDINALIVSTVHYDQAGRLKSRSQNDSRYTEHKIADFRVTDYDDRFDYRRDFAAYLHSIGRDDLIPR
ncbi:MAG: hypothetical protein IPL73_07680 [Candidatus Obscuribacter sp.]|nr:hypothetical protein [Candidatus Obscuribacter sp.]